MGRPMGVVVELSSIYVQAYIHIVRLKYKKKQSSGGRDESGNVKV